jgi:hypothetical protein
MSVPADYHAVTLDDLSVDVLANIFRYLGGPKSVMQKRCVCKKWKEAVKKTIVPPIYFCVHTVAKYNAMRVMAEALPNLLLITIGDLRTEYPITFGVVEHKYSDGEDPDDRVAAITADRVSHDIEIISNFRKLRILTL